MKVTLYTSDITVAPSTSAWTSSRAEISTKKPKKAVDFEAFLGFKVSEEVEKRFQKFLDAEGGRGPCAKNSILSLFDSDEDDGHRKTNFSLLSQDDIRQKVEDAFRKA
jgi:hypothetical protein